MTIHVHTIFIELVNVKELWDSVNLAVLTVSLLFQFQNRRDLKIIPVVKENRQVSLPGLKWHLGFIFNALLLAFK